ncbi:MAG: hypothetical protein COW03_01795 [Cytophagales bacterium CG12_big_fil_rev_8_21_14_0_65_40_12]|nr:MAG: hypothetical protein COW03_01795 [Cytophagales bacterium CG12_big_fil_rev_8_21_14_0_65_40_12]PIW02761.1 MAG: hypothetical protein COW40_18425 [Cytophagales bacterium CG17_big_fil_post_rev_8_21_14_2_50_40_13]
MRPIYTTFIFTITAAILVSCSSNSSTKTTADLAPEILSEEAKTISINEDLTLNNAQIVVYPSDNLKSAVQAKLALTGKNLNSINSDGSIYSIGSASTGVPSNSTGFINSRNIAFAKAELRAKIEILRLAGETITSERASNLIVNAKSGNDPDAKAKASLLEKAKTLLDTSIDRALIELGMSESEVRKMNESQKAKAYDEQFRNYVSSFVSSMIKGVSIVKIVEGEAGQNDYQVAVCVKYSPENQNIASQYKSYGASKNELNDEIINQLRSIDPNDLVAKLGAQIFITSSGQRVLVGFGQRPIRQTNSRQSNSETIAFRAARLQAIENIKNLIAEDLIGKEISESIEKIIEYQDGSSELYTEENYSEIIESKKTSIQLNSLELRQWKAAHPVSQSIIAGSIVILTEDNDVIFQTGNKANKTEKSDYSESKTLKGEDF